MDIFFPDKEHQTSFIYNIPAYDKYSIDWGLAERLQDLLNHLQSSWVTYQGLFYVLEHVV